MAVVLFVGHGGLPNGFSRVIQSLLTALRGRHELHHLAVNLKQAEPVDGWQVHPNPYLPALHSPLALNQTLDAVRPDAVIILDEAVVCARYLAALAPRAGEFAVVPYCAIDAEDAVTPQVAADLRRADALAVFTRFARRIVEQAVPDVPVHVIPHGVDTAAFFPLAGAGPAGFHKSRLQARRGLFSGHPQLDDAFIVLNANRNQPWKGIEVCIEGFARFAMGKPPGVKLYLHMGSRPALHGTVPLVDRFGIRDRLLVTATGERHPHSSSEDLNVIYNACDVGINTSEKEGWGLIAFEHGATGAAQIVPRHSVIPELWEGSALQIETVGRTHHPLLGRWGNRVSAEGVADALEKLYTQPELRGQLALAAYRNATRPEYDWREIALQWDGLLSQLPAVRRKSLPTGNSA